LVNSFTSDHNNIEASWQVSDLFILFLNEKYIKLNPYSFMHEGSYKDIKILTYILMPTSIIMGQQSANPT
jgi:hypothetical protein